MKTKSFDEVNLIYEEFSKMGQQMDIRFREMIWHYKNALGMKVDDRFTYVADKSKIMFFSDCVIWAHKLDEIPKGHYWFVVNEMISVMNLLLSVLIFKGVLIRGGVSVGDIFIDGRKVFGEGLVKAYELEKIAEYPRIVCDNEIFDQDVEDNSYMKESVFDLISKDSNGRFYSIDHFKMIEKAAFNSKNVDVGERKK